MSGVARKPDRTGLKSNYCTLKATAAFEDLIQHCDAKYILFSYNNMANKGNARSNARISDEDIFRILNAKGDVEVFSAKYWPNFSGSICGSTTEKIAKFIGKNVPEEIFGVLI